MNKSFRTFHCPLHKVIQYNVRIISTHIDSFEMAICEQCEIIKTKFESLDNYFYNQTKISNSLKTEIKNNPIEWFCIYEGDSINCKNDKLENFTCYRYLNFYSNNILIKINIYQTLFSSSQFRISIRSYNEIYNDIIQTNILPRHLIHDDNYLIQLLKK